MGADMLLSYVAHRTGVKPELDAAFRWIENLRPSDLVDSNAELEEAFSELECDTPLRFENDPAVLVKVKSILKDIVTAVISALESREITAVDICGYTCYFTGGLSWGDSPTEAFEVFNHLFEAGSLGTDALEAAGFCWPPREPDVFTIEEELSLHD